MEASVLPPAGGPGELLRDWRKRRRLSQLELALDAGVSTRHLSFVETGRSKPSRELLVALSEQLEVPLRERNALLLAGGYAPLYAETPLDADAMAPVREALDKILAGHSPFPAVVVDRRWNVFSINDPARAVLAEGVAPELLEPPINALRAILHPDGLAPRVANLGEYSAHLLTLLARQAAASADPALVELGEELRGYPGIEEGAAAAEPAQLLFVPLRIRALDADLTFFSTLASFGTALDITLAELAIEAFFPADKQTEAALRDAFG